MPSRNMYSPKNLGVKLGFTIAALSSMVVKMERSICRGFAINQCLHQNFLNSGLLKVLLLTSFSFILFGTPKMEKPAKWSLFEAINAIYVTSCMGDEECKMSPLCRQRLVQESWV